MFRRVARGFTLIELMIVVAVIAILASLAYYNYGRYAFRTRRADGREMLMRMAAAQERFFTNFNVYSASITNPATAGGLGFTSATSEKGYYTIGVVLGAGNLTYVLAATPAGAQVGDTCGILTLTDTGVKAPTGSPGNNGNCW
jgi:type IV pilus assembly protein PilE